MKSSKAHSLHKAPKTGKRPFCRAALVIIGLSCLMPSGVSFANSLSGPETTQSHTLMLNDHGGYPRLFLGVFDNFYAAIPDLLWVGKEPESSHIPEFEADDPGAGNPTKGSVVSI